MPGDKAYQYGLGDFRLVVGYFDGLARYMAAHRARGPLVPLSPAELAAVLALNAPASQWEITLEEEPARKSGKSKKDSRRSAKGNPPTRYFTHVEKDPKEKNKVIREIFGWMPGDEPYAFFYLPSLGGSTPILPSEWGVQAALG